MYDIIPIPFRPISLEIYIILYIFHSIIYTEKDEHVEVAKSTKTVVVNNI